MPSEGIARKMSQPCSEIQQIELEIVKLREMLRSTIDATSKQLDSHQKLLEKHTRCLEQMKQTLNEFKVESAKYTQAEENKRSQIDPTEELMNYQFVLEQRRSGRLNKETFKEALIKTLVPMLITLLGVGLLAYSTVLPYMEQLVKMAQQGG